jgi:hypothetical protein
MLLSKVLLKAYNFYFKINLHDEAVTKPNLSLYTATDLHYILTGITAFSPAYAHFIRHRLGRQHSNTFPSTGYNK